MLIPSSVIAETQRRFLARGGRRSVDLRDQDWTDAALRADAKERIYKRLDRIDLPHSFADVPAADVLRSPRTPGAALDVLSYERILGRSDLIGISFLEGGYQAAKSVVRIVLRGANGTLVGYGTGFMVSPQLILTNNHVLESPQAAAAAEIQFNYEDGVDTRMKTPRSFKLDPGAFFITSPALDYTLVAVRAAEGDLSQFGFSRLIEEEGKVLVGEFVNIIQHPHGEPKQLAIRENQIVDLLDQFLHYETDTAPGSSGSPVFNDQWEVVCLHHSGVPSLDAEGNYLTVDGQVWTEDMGEHRIKWIANEGVRVSRIIKDLRARATAPSELGMVDALLSASRSDGAQNGIQRAPANGLVPSAGGVLEEGEQTAVWTIPLTVAVHLGRRDLGAAALAAGSNGQVAGAHAPVVSTTLISEDGATLSAAVEERTPAIGDYVNRKGYDAGFLGEGFEVSLPALGSWASDAPPVAGAPDGEALVLRYTNFSVVMSQSRRMPVVTAVNIDGEQLLNLPRRGDAWSFDPRIPRDAQVGNELYAGNPLDRGHMVRRLDPVWGPHARTANEDTFHYTNACPQHAQLNQRTWNDLENYILDNAGARGLRVSVFTGPVLGHDDPDYRGLQIPREFWKIAALIDDETGELAASAYILSHSTLITDLAEFAFGQFRTYQVPIGRVARMTGLDFSRLSPSDVLGALSPREAAVLQRPINGPHDIVFHRALPKPQRRDSRLRPAARVAR